MYEHIIRNYVNKLTKQDIINYAIKENVKITQKEVDIIYYYIKNHWKDIMYNPEIYLDVAQENLSKEVYEKILSLKKRYKF